MSGRRLRATIHQALQDAGVANNNTLVVIAGLANAYSQYITTWEEYAIQRYEAASTLFGPNTLAAYQQLYYGLATALATHTPYPPGPTPPDLSGKTFSFQPGVIVDEPPLFGHFGKVYQDVSPSYTPAQLVTVVFYGANPRNDLRTQDTFLTVEQQVNGQWQVVYTDGDWDTKYHWQRRYVAESLITITWQIAPTVPAGTYRIQHFGNSKALSGTISPYTGTSSNFVVS